MTPDQSPGPIFASGTSRAEHETRNSQGESFQLWAMIICRFR